MSDLRHVLVTGATGFIGLALCGRLSRLGIEALCPIRAGSAHHAELAAIEGMHVRPMTSLDADAWRAAVPDSGIDAVFNLAAYGVHPKDRDPAALVAGNVGILAHLLGALEGRFDGPVVHVGSCSEYAPVEAAAPIDEEWPIAPVTPYGAAKTAAFHFGTALARHYGIRLATLRLFGVYGPHEGAWRLLPSLLDGLLADRSVDLSPGEQVRDMLHVRDVATALIAAAESDLAPWSAYNVCTGRGVTVKAIGCTVAKAVDRPRELLRFGALSYRDGETMYVVGDPRRFAAATGWSPEFDLDDGIADVIRHHV